MIVYLVLVQDNKQFVDLKVFKKPEEVEKYRERTQNRYTYTVRQRRII